MASYIVIMMQNYWNIISICAYHVNNANDVGIRNVIYCVFHKAKDAKLKKNTCKLKC